MEGPAPGKLKARPHPWMLHGVGALSLLLFLSWLSFKTDAVFGLATAFLLPIAWAGLTLPPGWSVFIGALASSVWLATAFRTTLPEKIGQVDWLTIPLIYPSLALLLSHVGQTRRSLAEALERERVSSRNDPLTGLYNRRGLFEAMEALRAGANDSAEKTIAFLDLDHFKKLNDSMGHEAGDALLRELGNALRAGAPEAVLSRIGGDEFVLVFPKGKPEILRRRLAELRQAMNAVCAKYWRRVTVSLGAAHFRKVWPNPDFAIAIGDAIMYMAKRAGRDRMCFKSLDPKDWVGLTRRAGSRVGKRGGR